MRGSETFGNALRRASNWIAPSPPDAIRDALDRARHGSVRRQVPMLLAVAALNIVIIMAVCAHDGMPVASYGWMSGLVFYCAIRFGVYVRGTRQTHDLAVIRKQLHATTWLALAMMAALGATATGIILSGAFRSELLVPTSLAFGATSIAHCLYTMRSAAIGTLILGMFPSAIAMMLVGSFDAQMLGLAMVSVAILMLRFVTEQNGQLITGLLLEDENRRLAMTDPLTGIANRRAIMAILDAAASADEPFTVALIDLDHFKQVNDSLGHHVGDQLLCEVAERLQAAISAGDVCGRLGGDEFIVLFAGIGDETDAAGQAGRLLAQLCLPAYANGDRLRFGASLGFATRGVHGSTVEQLLHRADEALYAAKRERMPDAIIPEVRAIAA